MTDEERAARRAKIMAHTRLAADEERARKIEKEAKE